jgi:hypothetical protein
MYVSPYLGRAGATRIRQVVVKITLEKGVRYNPKNENIREMCQMKDEYTLYIGQKCQMKDLLVRSITKEPNHLLLNYQGSINIYMGISAIYDV